MMKTAGGAFFFCEPSRTIIKSTENALKFTNGNKFRAAEVLQVSYKTLLTKIKDYQLEENGGE